MTNGTPISVGDTDSERADSTIVENAQPGLVPGTAGFRQAQVGLFMTGLATFALLYVVQPLLPLLGREFSRGATETSLVLSVTTLMLALAVLPMAWASERFGRARILKISLFAAAGLGVACAAAPNWPALLILRGVQGVALAGIPAAALAWINDEINPRYTSFASGLYIAGTTVGGMTGRLVSGGLATGWGWHGATLGVGILALACAVAAKLTLPSSTAVAPGTGSPTPTPGRSGTARSSGERSNGGKFSGGKTGGEFSSRELSSHRSSTRGFSTRRLRLYLVGGLAMAAFVGIYNVLAYRLEAPPYLLTPGVASLVFLAYLTGTYSSAKAGRLVGAIGTRWTMAGGLLVALAGVAMTLASPLPVLVLGVCLLTAGFFIAHAVASGQAAVGAVKPSLAAGRYVLCYYVGSSVGGPLVGSAYAAGGWELGAAAAGILLMMAAFVAPPAQTTRPSGRGGGEPSNRAPR